MPAAEARPVSITETRSLFAGLDAASGLLLAVSGGPDSTALMFLAARWRKRRKRKPKIMVVTVDHGLRPESRREALAVKRLAGKLRLPHRTVSWRGKKPTTSVQEAARVARYGLLAAAAKRDGLSHIVTAHTLDDQAETVLFRMARGSGVSGLGGMARQSTRDGLTLVRPLLDVPKERLLATLRRAKIRFADDPSNRDPRFARPRLRTLMHALAREGLDARRLALLARRLRRADAAIERAVDLAESDVKAGGLAGVSAVFDAARFARLPAETAVRLLGRAAARLGSEGPVELGKLEALAAALRATLLARKAGGGAFRRTLAGAVVTLSDGRIMVERAPARRSGRAGALTTGKRGRAKLRKAR